MHELLDVRPWPRILLRYPLLILTAFLLGGIVAFAYSYAPLHRAKDWKIGYLEERLASRNAHVQELETALQEAKSSLEGQPSNDDLKTLESRLAEANRLAKTHEKQIGELEAKLASATRSRDSWKSRHASTLAELERLKSTAGGSPAPSVAATPRGDTVDADPGPADALDPALPASPASEAPNAPGPI